MSGTDTNTLVERLQKTKAFIAAKNWDLSIGSVAPFITAIDDTIAALSPVLPEDVQEALQYLRVLGLFNTDPVGHRKMAADLIERLAANAQMWQAASATALEEARKADELLKLEKEMKGKHLARIAELEAAQARTEAMLDRLADPALMDTGGPLSPNELPNAQLRARIEYAASHRRKDDD